MQVALRCVAAVLGFGILISAGLVVKGLLDANERIDRCADETSGKYIFDDEARATACK
ncbi:hypothetical protein QE435_002480 [Rhizobium sp. SORGH_AS 787]|uniref:Uncharacterized protein n=1 Tax=Agrobacterium larrymoorei TaxID=160699 RepID=A0AAJ2BEG1_9HYPH|nr:hypothetical protein [Rhizobium sp. SORGH_AS_0787]MDR6103382.1 hypothetical protein [Agrobacterium larrymoorei]